MYIYIIIYTYPVLIGSTLQHVRISLALGLPGLQSAWTHFPRLVVPERSSPGAGGALEGRRCHGWQDKQQPMGPWDNLMGFIGIYWDLMGSILWLWKTRENSDLMGSIGI